MCGILGGNNPGWDYKKGIHSIRHRGPDGMKIEILPGAVFAFTRLAVMDLSEAAMQPMYSSDKKVCMVFNGEIYGFEKLRKSLKMKGFHFKTTSDTEVLLNAYMAYGDAFIDKVDGMFAIAIYDMRSQKIKLYRDRAGIKPLYFYWDGKNFAFASELKALTETMTDIKLNIDKSAIYDFLTYQYIPDPKSLYQHIYKLKAAHTTVYDIKRSSMLRQRPYWKLNASSRQRESNNLENIQYEVRELITASVKEQMVADVKVGSFLSGGVDSSIITYEALKYNPDIETFSMGFSDRQVDELRYAQMTADYLGIQSNSEIVYMEEFKRLYPELKFWYDEPFCDLSAYPTYKVSELAKRKVTVVLTGDGGDEVFGGYSRYERYRETLFNRGINNKDISKAYENLRSMLKLLGVSREVDEFLMEEIACYTSNLGGMTKKEKRSYRKIFGISSGYDDYWFFRKHYKKELPPITRMQYLDFHTYLPADILTKVDRASMRHSLETRVPLLSKKIIEYAFALAEEDRCCSHQAKGVLKKAYEPVLPREVLYRKKMGFGLPDTFMDHDAKDQEILLNTLWSEYCK